ncbi:helix-turn-helix domain-containing protein [Paenibacillus tuaregi]|uniref:helix-turn-helix domain-containing protein n=1 Tax=Paenibacillus tuaregi TaxID=1816681 RepID=UPI000837F4AB|nr:transcriptional regulator [Paenibacillus tuaregi]
MDTLLLGEFIKEGRKRKGLSLRGLAEAAGISPSQLSKLERGQVKLPEDRTLERLAETLNVDKFDFFALAGRVYTEKNADPTEEILQGIKEVAASLEDFRNSFDAVQEESEDFGEAIYQLLRRKMQHLSEDQAKEAALEMKSAFDLWEKRTRNARIFGRK